jgi:hypothetical protein
MAIWPAQSSPAQAQCGPGTKRPSPTWPDRLRARAGQHYGLRSLPSTSPRLIFRAGPARGTTRPIVLMGRVPARNTTSGGCGGGRSFSGGGGGGRWRRKVGRRAPTAAWAVPPQTSAALAPLPPAQALAALAPPPPRRSAAPAQLLHCARRCCALAPAAPPAASHGAVLCQHGWRHGWRACTASPGRRLAAAGGAGSPGRGLPWRAVLAPPSSGT